MWHTASPVWSLKISKNNPTTTGSQPPSQALGFHGCVHAGNPVARSEHNCSCRQWKDFHRTWNEYALGRMLNICTTISSAKKKMIAQILRIFTQYFCWNHSNDYTYRRLETPSRKQGYPIIILGLRDDTKKMLPLLLVTWARFGFLSRIVTKKPCLEDTMVFGKTLAKVSCTLAV